MLLRVIKRRYWDSVSKNMKDRSQGISGIMQHTIRVLLCLLWFGTAWCY